jgi:hypothetical protein
MINGKNEQELRDWFVKAKGHICAYQLPETDARAVYVLSQFFEGALATWFQGMQALAANPTTADFPSVSDLRDAALKQFTGRDPAEVARDNLRNKRQIGTVLDWANFVRRQLVHLPRRDEEDNLHTFQAGLKADIAKALAPQKPKTLAEAIEMAIRIEASIKLIDKRQPLTGRSPELKGRAHQLNNVVGDDYDDTVGDEVDSVCEEVDDEEVDDDLESVDLNNAQGDYVQRSKQEIARLRREKRCLRCAARGHIAKHCPKRQASPTPAKVGNA